MNNLGSIVVDNININNHINTNSKNITLKTPSLTPTKSNSLSIKDIRIKAEYANQHSDIKMIGLATKLTVLTLAHILYSVFGVAVLSYFAPMPALCVDAWTSTLCAMYCFHFYKKDYQKYCFFCNRIVFYCCAWVIFTYNYHEQLENSKNENINHKHVNGQIFKDGKQHSSGNQKNLNKQKQDQDREQNPLQCIERQYNLLLMTTDVLSSRLIFFCMKCLLLL